MGGSKMIKQYVEFLFPGSLLVETSVKEVKKRDPSKVVAPEGCFGYRFFEQQVVDSGGETLYGEHKKYSGTYYFGTVKTLDDIKQEMPKSGLLKGMERNKLKKVIKTRCGNYQPFRSIDVVVAEK